MKLKLFFGVIFFQISLMASTIEVVGACSETAQFISTDTQHDENTTLGDLTVKVFQDNQIPFQGSREGIKTIMNSPTGDDAIDIISDTEARFYGWCVHVDGVEPSLMPDKVILTNPKSKIVWFYAYAKVVRDQWTEMCVPAHTAKDKKFCPAN